MHIVTCENFRVARHVHGGERLAWKVGEPIMELVVTRREEAALIIAKDVAYGEFWPAAVAMVQKFRGIDAVAQE